MICQSAQFQNRACAICKFGT